MNTWTVVLIIFLCFVALVYTVGTIAESIVEVERLKIRNEKSVKIETDAKELFDAVGSHNYDCYGRPLNAYDGRPINIKRDVTGSCASCTSFGTEDKEEPCSSCSHNGGGENHYTRRSSEWN